MPIVQREINVCWNTEKNHAIPTITIHSRPSNSSATATTHTPTASIATRRTLPKHPHVAAQNSASYWKEEAQKEDNYDNKSQQIASGGTTSSQQQIERSLKRIREIEVESSILRDTTNTRNSQELNKRFKTNRQKVMFSPTAAKHAQDITTTSSSATKSASHSKSSKSTSHASIIPPTASYSSSPVLFPKNIGFLAGDRVNIVTYELEVPQPEVLAVERVHRAIAKAKDEYHTSITNVGRNNSDTSPINPPIRLGKTHVSESEVSFIKENPVTEDNFEADMNNRYSLETFGKTEWKPFPTLPNFGSCRIRDRKRQSLTDYALEQEARQQKKAKQDLYFQANRNKSLFQTTSIPINQSSAKHEEDEYHIWNEKRKAALERRRRLNDLRARQQQHKENKLREKYFQTQNLLQSPISNPKRNASPSKSARFSSPSHRILSPNISRYTNLPAGGRYSPSRISPRRNTLQTPTSARNRRSLISPTSVDRSPRRRSKLFSEPHFQSSAFPAGESIDALTRRLERQINQSAELESKKKRNKFKSQDKLHSKQLYNEMDSNLHKLLEAIHAAEAFHKANAQAAQSPKPTKSASRYRKPPFQKKRVSSPTVRQATSSMKSSTMPPTLSPNMQRHPKASSPAFSTSPIPLSSISSISDHEDIYHHASSNPLRYPEEDGHWNNEMLRFLRAKYEPKKSP